MKQYLRYFLQKSWIICMGQDAHEAVHNAVVLEEVAKMAPAVS